MLHRSPRQQHRKIRKFIFCSLQQDCPQNSRSPPQDQAGPSLIELVSTRVPCCNACTADPFERLHRNLKELSTTSECDLSSGEWYSRLCIPMSFNDYILHHSSVSPMARAAVHVRLSATGCPCIPPIVRWTVLPCGVPPGSEHSSHCRHVIQIQPEFLSFPISCT